MAGWLAAGREPLLARWRVVARVRFTITTKKRKAVKRTALLLGIDAGALYFVRRPVAGTAEEKLLAVGKLQVAAVRPV